MTDTDSPAFVQFGHATVKPANSTLQLIKPHQAPLCSTCIGVRAISASLRHAVRPEEVRGDKSFNTCFALCFNKTTTGKNSMPTT